MTKSSTIKTQEMACLEHLSDLDYFQAQEVEATHRVFLNGNEICCGSCVPIEYFCEGKPTYELFRPHDEACYYTLLLVNADTNRVHYWKQNIIPSSGCGETVVDYHPPDCRCQRYASLLLKQESYKSTCEPEHYVELVSLEEELVSLNMWYTK